MIAPEVYTMMEKAVRAHLATLPCGVQISTAQLVDALYSRDEERELAFRAIKTMGHGALADCWVAGPLKIQYGKETRPKQWRRPEPKACPHCGKEIP